MALYSYTYDGRSEFSGSINLKQLTHEINNSNDITATLHDVIQNGDILAVRFLAELDAGEQSALTSLVTSHVASTDLNYSNIITILPSTNRFTANNVYSKIISFQYMGNYSTTIDKIKILCYMDSGITSYDIKIVNIKSSLTLGSGNFNNTVEALCSIDTITNIPKSSTTLDIYVKKNGGGGSLKIYITNILILLV